jgi:hypothetical protein
VNTAHRSRRSSTQLPAELARRRRRGRVSAAVAACSLLYSLYRGYYGLGTERRSPHDPFGVVGRAIVG